VCNPATELADVSEMQHCNLSWAVLLVLEKLRGQTKKERKRIEIFVLCKQVNVRSVVP
jgi:hypothetical protein